MQSRTHFPNFASGCTNVNHQKQKDQSWISEPTSDGGMLVTGHTSPLPELTTEILVGISNLDHQHVQQGEIASYNFIFHVHTILIWVYGPFKNVLHVSS